MSDYLKMELCRRAYLPLCALNIMLAYLSLGFVLWISTETYLSGMSKSSLMTFLEVIGYVGAVLILHFNFMISTGRGFWLKAAAGVLIVCLVIALPSVVYGAGWLVYAFAILFPVLGLLSLNSNRHRKFCVYFIELRSLRATSSFCHSAKERRRSMKKNSRNRREANILVEKSFVHVKSRSQTRGCKRRITPIRILIGLGGAIFAGFSVLMMWSAVRLIYKGVVTGIVVGSNGRGPLAHYSISQAPWMYGLSMFVLVLAIFLFFLTLRLSILIVKGTFED